MDIKLLKLLKGLNYGKSYDSVEKYDAWLEEKIVSVIYSLNGEINELNQQAQNNDLSKEYLSQRIRLMEIKIKHLKRLAG